MNPLTKGKETEMFANEKNLKLAIKLVGRLNETVGERFMHEYQMRPISAEKAHGFEDGLVFAIKTLGWDVEICPHEHSKTIKYHYRLGKYVG